MSSSSFYQQLIQRGANNTETLAKVKSSSYMRTVVKQRRARNPHHDYFDPFNDTGTIVTSVTTLYDEMSGLCGLTGEVVGDFGTSYEPEEPEISEPIIVETLEVAAGAGDGYEYDLDITPRSAEEIAASAASAASDMAATDYNEAITDAIEGKIENETKGAPLSKGKRESASHWISLITPGGAAPPSSDRDSDAASPMMHTEYGGGV